MAAQKRRTGQRRRRGRFGFLYKLLSLVIILSALAAGCVVFFKVNEVTVTGNQRYTAQEIIDASGVTGEDNLLLINGPRTVRAINRKLPYVETISVIRRLPDTLELKITETTGVARIQCGESWWLINEGTKLLEEGDGRLGEGLPWILGLKIIDPAPGSRLQVELADQTKAESIPLLFAALEKEGLTEQVYDFIDYSETSRIRFSYGDALTVVVPVTGDFGRRILSLRRVLETFAEQGQQVTGTLDLTYGDGEARLLTERWLPAS